MYKREYFMNNERPENFIDCLGDMCPIPMIKFQNIEAAVKEGKAFIIVTDHSCASENIMDYCKNRKYPFTVKEPISGVWEIHVNPVTSKEPNSFNTERPNNFNIER